MKVLIIASYAESLINFRGELIASMIANGIEVCIACPDIYKHHATVTTLVEKGVEIHDIPLHRTGINPAYDIKTLLVLFRLMRVIRPDAVLAYTIKPVIYGLLAASMAKVPQRFALITGLGYAFTGKAKGLRRVIQTVVQRLYREALSKASMVFFQNTDDEALFRELRIIRQHVCSRIVNGSGVDTAYFAPEPLPDKPVFLLIARLLGDKGIREYAAAAALVKRQYPEVCFELVGWVDKNPDAITQQELDTWVKKGIIDFKGKMTDVRPAIANSSVYVLPSYREGTPRTVLEAMSMGRTIITTDAPGCRETVESGVNGFLVPVHSVERLADGMLKLIQNPDLISQYGRNSRRIAEAKYDVHKVNAYMLKEMGMTT